MIAETVMFTWNGHMLYGLSLKNLHQFWTYFCVLLMGKRIIRPTSIFVRVDNYVNNDK